MPCKRCQSKTLTRDGDTSNLICVSCGTVQDYDSFETRTFTAEGPAGLFVRVGTSGTGSTLNYKDKKIYEANKLISEVISRLNLYGCETELKSMISRITEGEFGTGDWFPVLIGACVYVIMRGHNKPLPINEVGNAVGCDAFELGGMVSRVVTFLDLRLPGFDLVESYVRLLRKFSGFRRIERDKVERIREQGVFLVNCAVKWFLSTGRRPLPVVAAVLVFVLEVNGIEEIRIEEVAREVRAAVITCHRRYKELLKRLVEVARVGLPWGKDVTVKNVVKNAPFLLKYMELKSMEDKGKGGKEGEEGSGNGVDLGEVVKECLGKHDLYCYGEERAKENDLRYFRGVEDGVEIDGLGGGDDADGLQLSPECLSLVYNEFLKRGDGGDKFVKEVDMVHRGRKRKHQLYELLPTDWWDGKSELSKKLLLKQILEKDVGLDVMPPSFLRGCQANERRRAKIKAAKKRIERIMHPQGPASYDSERIMHPRGPTSDDSGDGCLWEVAHTKERKIRQLVKDVDWEDFIIETLLLHHVKEDQIMTGHYNTLLDLHVFNSGIV